MDILKMQAGYAMDAMVAEKAYNCPIIWIDYWSIGEKIPYVIDVKAVKTDEHCTSANMIGASWQKYKDDEGNLKEFYGRSVPNYSTSLDSFIYIEKKIKEFGKIKEYIDNLNFIVNESQVDEKIKLFNMLNASALDKCKSFLLTM